MDEIVKYSGCFVCGDQNPIGLKARFHYDGEKAISEVVADQRYEGYRSIFHGGIISTMLDEVMIKAILAEDIYAVTAELTVRFMAPVHTGDRLAFTGWVTRRKGRMYFTEGEVRVDDQVVAGATGKYLEARQGMQKLLKESID